MAHEHHHHAAARQVTRHHPAAHHTAAGLHLAVGHWIAVIVVAAVIGAVFAGLAREGLTRVRYGARRPWLSFLARVRFGLHPGPGWAGAWSLRRDYGKPAARRVARHARPSLTWAARRFGSWREYASFLGWASARRRLYAHMESLVLVIAAPQEGKSRQSAGWILDAPGPVVATSIRGDLIAATAPLRSARGQVHVWNPEEAGDAGSTFSWNVVAGCEDMATAVRRAGNMVEAVTGAGRSEDAFWNDQACMVLASFLHAAALGGGDMRHVDQWVTRDGDSTPLRVLTSHPGAAARARDTVSMYLALTPRTRQGITTTLSRVLKFMLLPACAEAVIPASGGSGFDFTAFVGSRDTLYLVAGDSATSPVPPLFTCIIAELAHAARQAGAAARPARPPRESLAGSAGLARLAARVARPKVATRLDPPLTCVLDEVANVAPVPVAAWSSWAAGSGILLRLIAQSYAQLEDRWGERGARQIWQDCKTKLIYGGTSDTQLGEIMQQVCGDVRLRTHVRGYDGKRAHGTETVPALPADMLRQLPRGRAVLIQDHGAPTIVRVESFTRRADYKRARRAGMPARLPFPADRPVPEPAPGMLNDPGQSRPSWIPETPLPPATYLTRREGGEPSDELAARRERRTRPPDPGQDGPRRRRDDTSPGPVQPPGTPRRPVPPTRPAPWELPADGTSGDQ